MRASIEVHFLLTILVIRRRRTRSSAAGGGQRRPYDDAEGIAQTHWCLCNQPPIIAPDTTTNHRQPLPNAPPPFLSSLVFSFPFAAALAQPLGVCPVHRSQRVTRNGCLGKSDRPQSSVVRESEPSPLPVMDDREGMRTKAMHLVCCHPLPPIAQTYAKGDMFE